MAGISLDLELLVAKRTDETKDIVALELVSRSGDNLPPFTAGAHIDVQVPGGPVRQYSLCNEPGVGKTYALGILRDPVSRGGSLGIHEHVQEGSLLQVSEPRNHFPLDESAQHSILLAGGIGVTPILCMARRLSALEHSFEMHYCTRSSESTAFIESIAASTFGDKVHHHFDDGGQEQLLDIPGLLAAPRDGVHVYVCGPGGFMDAVLGAARTAGWPEEQLHSEFFSAEVGVKEDDGNFQIELAKSGKTVTVAADQTAVDALAAAGVDVPVSCEQGVCGTCLMTVLEGEPDHRDMYLTPDEQAANNQFTPCCSRSNTAVLVVDA
ncbi:MAG: PDR/VanB family oxidoreductase [Halieaceae bacterium]|nr:PDR/VanB family oxidoreductase [Halieaceae bacterium]